MSTASPIEGSSSAVAASGSSFPEVTVIRLILCVYLVGGQSEKEPDRSADPAERRTKEGIRLTINNKIIAASMLRIQILNLSDNQNRKTAI